MSMERFQFSGTNGKKLSAVLWQPEQPAQGLVQIVHGMTEHMGRYHALAEELTAAGLIVAGYDLRGHGEDVVNPGIASFGEGGWEDSLEDMKLFSDLLAERFPELPRHLLGFSLGSFLLREYVGRWPEDIASVALLGTGQQNGAVLTLIQAIVRTQIRKVGHDQTTELIRNLSFGTYNKKFPAARTASDWLCADEKQLAAYVQDPLCRRDISAGLFWQLLGSMKRCGSTIACNNWNREMPVLLLSGKDDPVGDSGKGVFAVEKQLQKAGLSTVEVQLLPGARHDLLHEEACGAAAEARQILRHWFTENNRKG